MKVADKTIKMKLTDLEEMLKTMREYVPDGVQVVHWLIDQDGVHLVDRTTNKSTLYEGELDWDKPICSTCGRYTKCTYKDSDCPYNPFNE